MEVHALPLGDRAVVVAFDMCSSSNIIDDLTKSKNLNSLVAFLDALQRYLAKEQASEVAFTVYKFTGDGWLLLFPQNTNGTGLLCFLERLCLFFAVQFRRLLLPRLTRQPKIIGISFGIDRGDLIPLLLNGRNEYVGRAINIACRLQTSVKDKGESPAYSALVSDIVYSEYFADADPRPHRVAKVTRNLRNINNATDFACRRLWLMRPYHPTAGPN